MKTCSRALRTSDWGIGSPSNSTMILSTEPRQRRSGFGTSLAQPEPRLEPDRTSLERPENSCAATLPIQPDGVWEDLQRRMGETSQIQVCQACSVIPKKTWGCNRCKVASTKYWINGLNTFVNVIFNFYNNLFSEKIVPCFCFVVMGLLCLDWWGGIKTI